MSMVLHCPEDTKIVQTASSLAQRREGHLEHQEGAQNPGVRALSVELK